MSVKGDKMQARLLNQFQVSARLKSLLDAINNRFDDSDDVLDYLLYYRFLDTASGVWLDTIGIILGLYPRPYVEREDGIFTYTDLIEPNDPDLGYSDVALSTGGVWNSLKGLPTDTLVDDATYRALLTAKIFSTYAEPTIPNVYLFIKLAFNDTESTITVPTPGTVEVELATAITNYERNLLVQLAPVAAGYDVIITNWP